MKTTYLNTRTKLLQHMAMWSIILLWTEIAGERCPIWYELRRNPSKSRQTLQRTPFKDDYPASHSPSPSILMSIKVAFIGWLRLDNHLHMVFAYLATNRT